MKGYIYKYTFPNGKMYVGQTIHPQTRHYEHIYASKHRKLSKVCELAIAKYGEPKMEIIDTIEVEDHERLLLFKLLNEAEKKWIKHYDSTTKSGKGYNILGGGKRYTPEDFILEEAWWEIYEKNWREPVENVQWLLYERIRPKLFETHEKFDKTEKAIWYGYKFMDYSDLEKEKETTFSGFYKKRKELWKYQPSNYILDEESETMRPDDKDSFVFYMIMQEAIQEHWMEDIRQTIWRQIMKKKEQILKIYKIKTETKGV